MKLCFYHQKFDIDVSSGTEHALSQWHELAMAFGVTEIAIINETDDEIKQINEDITITQYPSLEEFLDDNSNFIFVEMDGENHHQHNIDNDAWYVFGGYQGIPTNLEPRIKIDTKVALYPREAAAIILENIWRQST